MFDWPATSQRSPLFPSGYGCVTAAVDGRDCAFSPTLNAAKIESAKARATSRWILAMLCNLFRSFLEFSGVFFGPAFDDDFLVGVELDRVAALRVHVSEEAGLPSRKGEIGHGRGYADIDADVASR